MYCHVENQRRIKEGGRQRDGGAGQPALTCSVETRLPGHLFSSGDYSYTGSRTQTKDVFPARRSRRSRGFPQSVLAGWAAESLANRAWRLAASTVLGARFLLCQQRVTGGGRKASRAIPSSNKTSACVCCVGPSRAARITTCCTVFWARILVTDRMWAM